MSKTLIEIQDDLIFNEKKPAVYDFQSRMLQLLEKIEENTRA